MGTVQNLSEVNAKSPVRPVRGHGRMEALALYRTVEHVVAHSFSVPEPELRARTRRTASVALARQVAMYLAHVAGGLSLTEVGDLAGRDRTTAGHACRLVEDRRDDPGFDRTLMVLEGTLSRVAPRPAHAGFDAA